MQRLDQVMIVPAGPGDAAALGEVHVRAWRETYRGLLPAAYLERMNPQLHARRWRGQLRAARPDDVVLAAEGRRGLVGYCAGQLLPEAAAGEVFTLYVLRAAQRRGVGRALLRAAALTFAARGAAALQLWVLDGNDRAAAFYTHLGGVDGPSRAVRGWGGGLTETLYRWPDIAVLTGG